MTVSTSALKHTYNGNGVTTQFPFTFPVSAIADVAVYITDNLSTQTKLTNGYLAALNNPLNPSGGGTVTYPYPSGTVLPSGWKILIKRETPVEQLVDLVNQGPYYAEEMERALDKTVMTVQEINDNLSRVPMTNADGIDLSLTPSAGQVIGWGPDGTNLMNYPYFVPDDFGGSSLANHSREFNLKWFGAVLDGVADDTVPLQNALDFIDSIGGGTLFIPPRSVCRITGTVTLCDNLIIRADLASILIDPTEYLENAIMLTGSTGVRIDVTEDVSAGDLHVHVADSAGVVPGDCIFLYQNIWNGGYAVDSLIVSDVTATQIDFNTPILVPYQVSNGAQVILQKSKSNIIIDGLTLRFSDSSDVTCGAWFAYVRNMILRNVHVENQRSITSPVDQKGIFINHAYKLKIENCHFDKPLDGAGAGLIVSGANFCTIDGCTCTDYRFGIAVSSSVGPRISNCILRGKSGGASIRGIKVVGCQSPSIHAAMISGYGVGIKYENSGKGVISGCTFASCGASWDSVAISCSNQFIDISFESYNVISNNTIINQWGAAVYIPTGGYYTIISNNVINDCTDGGIICQVPCSINHNIIRNWGINPSKYAVWFAPGSIVTYNSCLTASPVARSFYCAPAEFDDGTVFVGNQAPKNAASITDYSKFGVCHSNFLLNLGQREFWRSSLPTTGTFLQGDKIYNSAPSPGSYLGWECIASGTLGVLEGVTANTTLGSAEITVNSSSQLKINDRIIIAGVTGTKYIIDINDTSVTLDSAADATVTGATVKFSPGETVYPYIFKGFGAIESTRTIKASGPPNTGTWFWGDVVENSNPSYGRYKGWVCIQRGTFGHLEGCTASGTAGSYTITVSDGSKLHIDDHILIDGLTGTKYVMAINGNIVTLYAPLNGTCTNAAVSFSPPIFQGYGQIQNMFSVYFGYDIPTTGTYIRGDRIENLLPAAGGYLGWVCTEGGTMGTLNGVTASVTDGSDLITVNTTVGLEVNARIVINGSTKLIMEIWGNTCRMQNAYTFTGNYPVSYYPATFKAYGPIEV